MSDYFYSLEMLLQNNVGTYIFPVGIAILFDTQLKEIACEENQ